VRVVADGAIVPAVLENQLSEHWSDCLLSNPNELPSGAAHQLATLAGDTYRRTWGDGSDVLPQLRDSFKGMAGPEFARK
jgi:hypothetical protein